MKKILLILGALILCFVGCEKDPVYEEGTVVGHVPVDLGLSVRWASCNVGALFPEDYGNYYAWGETETKKEYTEENSLTYGLSMPELQAQGIIDSEGNLTSSHDAATANWGSGWRMPTMEECQELVDSCTWTWTDHNNVEGYKVTGPNGNSIFLPAAGSRFGSSLSLADGCYWSSTTPFESDTYRAYSLNFVGGYHRVSWGFCSNYGLSVRPVAE